MGSKGSFHDLSNVPFTPEQQSNRVKLFNHINQPEPLPFYIQHPFYSAMVGLLALSATVTVFAVAMQFLASTRY